LDSPKCGEHLFFPGETLILPRPNVLNIVFFRAKPRWTAPNVHIFGMHAYACIFGMHAYAFGMFGLHACILRRNVSQNLLK